MTNLQFLLLFKCRIENVKNYMKWLDHILFFKNLYSHIIPRFAFTHDFHRTYNSRFVSI